MNEIAIFFGCTFFACVMLIHIFVWRIFKPEKHITLPLAMFLGIPILIFSTVFILGTYKNLLTQTEFIAAIVLYFSLAVAYVMTYPAVQAISPSLKIVYFIEKNSSEGLSEDELIEIFKKDKLVQDRLDDLFIENLIFEKNNLLCLTQKGAFLAKLFRFYRKIYSLKTGEG